MDDIKMKSAQTWLDKAIKFEAEGKSAHIVQMSLDKACNLEMEALGLASSLAEKPKRMKAA